MTKIKIVNDGKGKHHSFGAYLDAHDTGWSASAWAYGSTEYEARGLLLNKVSDIFLSLSQVVKEQQATIPIPSTQPP